MPSEWQISGPIHESQIVALPSIEDQQSPNAPAHNFCTHPRSLASLLPPPANMSPASDSPTCALPSPPSLPRKVQCESGIITSQISVLDMPVERTDSAFDLLVHRFLWRYDANCVLGKRSSGGNCPYGDRENNHCRGGY
jgi:hypothetical protein